MASLVPCSTSNSLLVPLSNSSFSDIYCIHPYIFSHILSLQATNNFLSLTLLSSTFLHVLLLIYYGITRLYLFLVLWSLQSIPHVLQVFALYWICVGVCFTYDSYLTAFCVILMSHQSVPCVVVGALLYSPHSFLIISSKMLNLFFIIIRYI